MLGMTSPRELMRKGEDAYKAGHLDNQLLTADELIAAMIATPKLIERPIVVYQGQARIGRPPEQVTSGFGIFTPLKKPSETSCTAATLKKQPA